MRQDARLPPGWFDWEDVYSELAETATGPIVEIGVLRGRSITYLLRRLTKANAHQKVKVVAVDLWTPKSVADHDDSDPQGFSRRNPFAEYLANSLTYLTLEEIDRMLVVRQESVRVARMFEPGEVYATFVDGAHDYDSVRRDCLAWLPKTHRLLGHDWHIPDVKRAVREVARLEGLELKTLSKNCWELLRN